MSCKSLNLIIFSKDRACQLHSLLRSIRDNLCMPRSTTTILYKSTNSQFSKGYDRLIKSNVLPEEIQWVRESSFRDDLLSKLVQIDDKSLVMFLVDDDVIFRDIDGTMHDIFSHRHLFISYRASRTYKDDIHPRFINMSGYLEWKWKFRTKKPVTWNYPFCLDGNVYHAYRMKKIAHRLSYNAPNSFEGRMHTYRHSWRVKLICRAIAPLQPCIFNNPLNKVQTEGSTWNAGISADMLNEKYMDGWEIDNGKLYSCNPTSVHCAFAPEFVRCAE